MSYISGFKDNEGYSLSLGVIQITSGAIRITDPCYSPDTWCADQASAKNGLWRTEIGYTKDDFDIKRYQKLIDKLKEKINQSDDEFIEEYYKIELNDKQKLLDNYKGRIAYIRIIHESLTKSKVEIQNMDKLIKSVGVDSGQAGFCDLEMFKSLKMWHDHGEGEHNYTRVCDLTCDEENGAGILDNCAVFSLTAYGDGSYPCYARKNEIGENVEFVIAYIVDENEDSSSN